MKALFNEIIRKCDPDEFVDRLGLNTRDLVYAFSHRIDLQPEAFEDLIHDLQDIEDDSSPIEEELSVVDYSWLQQLSEDAEEYDL